MALGILLWAVRFCPVTPGWSLYNGGKLWVWGKEPMQTRFFPAALS